MALIGIAPLTMVRTRAGRSEYVYAGALAPEDILDQDRERLVEEGFLEEVADVELPDEVVVADDPATGGPGQGVTVERPKSVATKPVWAAFRGLTEDQANDLTLEQLKDDDFMASYQLQATTPPPPAV